MADLFYQYTLATTTSFQQRVQAALINAALAVTTEVVNEVQTVATTGTVTSGSFILNGIPTSVTITGTLANSATTCTGMASTLGLAIGMSITGTGINAGTTIAAILSATAITLSTATTASAAGAQVLTFTGNSGAVSVPFNATAGTLQGLLKGTSLGGQVTCSGGPLPTAISVTFNGSFAGMPLNLMTTGTNSLVGGGSPVIARTTAGVSFPNHTARAAQASRILNGSVDLLKYCLAVAGNSTVQGDFDTQFKPDNGTITGATNANPIVITTSQPHGLTNGQLVQISGVGGNTAANVSSTAATVVSPTTFSIAIAGNGAYTSGGVYSLTEGQVASDIQFTVNSNWDAFN